MAVESEVGKGSADTSNYPYSLRNFYKSVSRHHQRPRGPLLVLCFYVSRGLHQSCINQLSGSVLGPDWSDARPRVQIRRPGSGYGWFSRRLRNFFQSVRLVPYPPAIGLRHHKGSEACIVVMGNRDDQLPSSRRSKEGETYLSWKTNLSFVQHHMPESRTTRRNPMHAGGHNSYMSTQSSETRILMSTTTIHLGTCAQSNAIIHSLQSVISYASPLLFPRSRVASAVTYFTGLGDHRPKKIPAVSMDHLLASLQNKNNTLPSSIRLAMCLIETVTISGPYAE